MLLFTFASFLPSFLVLLQSLFCSFSFPWVDWCSFVFILLKYSNTLAFCLLPSFVSRIHYSILLFSLFSCLFFFFCRLSFPIFTFFYSSLCSTLLCSLNLTRVDIYVFFFLSKSQIHSTCLVTVDQVAVHLGAGVGKSSSESTLRRCSLARRSFMCLFIIFLRIFGDGSSSSSSSSAGCLLFMRMLGLLACAMDVVSSWWIFLFFFFIIQCVLFVTVAALFFFFQSYTSARLFFFLFFFLFFIYNCSSLSCASRFIYLFHNLFRFFFPCYCVFYSSLLYTLSVTHISLDQSLFIYLFFFFTVSIMSPSHEATFHPSIISLYHLSYFSLSFCTFLFFSLFLYCINYFTDIIFLYHL